MNEDNPLSSNTVELICWIVNVDSDNYKQYENILKKTLYQESVDGSYLADIDSVDVKTWQIPNFKHRKKITKLIII